MNVRPLARPTLRRVRPVLAALALAVGMGAQAAPEGGAGNDSLLGLLQERGLISAVDNPIMQTVRDKASDLVISAMTFLGVPYRLGGNSAETGFDCSGFTRHIFQSTVGLVLPRRADEQASAPGLVQVQRDELKPGDLVFFNTLRRTFSHVGIYVGDGKFIHSPRTGGQVRVEDMRIAYWAQRFNGARRVPLAEQTADSRATTAR